MSPRTESELDLVVASSHTLRSWLVGRGSWLVARGSWPVGE